MSAKTQILKLALAGVAPGRISVETGVTVHTVYHHLSRARSKGLNIPKFKGGGARSGVARIMFPPEVEAAMVGPASARGMTTRELSAEILRIVALEGMVDAVLDDGGADA